MNELEAEMLTPEWSREAILALRDVGMALRVKKPLDVGKILTLESGRTLSPKARYPRDLKQFPVAVGLTQITRPAAVEAGFIDRNLSPDAQKAAYIPFANWVLSLSVENQLRHVILPQLQASPWYKAGKPFEDAARLYLMNFAAGKAFVSSDPATVLAVAGEPLYEGNRGLDSMPPKGKITYGDLEAAMNDVARDPVYQALALRYEKLVAA